MILSYKFKLFVHFLIVIAIAAISSGANPLRVDINSTTRADMCTVGWENWLPQGDIFSQSFGDVTVTLRAGGKDGAIGLSGKKSLVVNGVTVGADGAVAAGSETAVMEVKIEGLAPGLHTFIGYHHVFNGDTRYLYGFNRRRTKSRVFKLQSKQTTMTRSQLPLLSFRPETGEPVVIRITATQGDSVILNGFALDVADPARKALKPMPAKL